QPDGFRFVLGHDAREPLSERPEQLGTGLEAVLVEVVAGAPARAEDEVALEVGVLAQRGAELGLVVKGALNLQARGSAGRAAAAAPPRRASPAKPSTRLRNRRRRARAGGPDDGERAACRRPSRPRAACRSGGYDFASVFFFRPAAGLRLAGERFLGAAGASSSRRQLFRS